MATVPTVGSAEVKNVRVYYQSTEGDVLQTFTMDTGSYNRVSDTTFQNMIDELDASVLAEFPVGTVTRHVSYEYNANTTQSTVIQS